jgi:hypothetical protein
MGHVYTLTAFGRGADALPGNFPDVIAGTFLERSQLVRKLTKDA